MPSFLRFAVLAPMLAFSQPPSIQEVRSILREAAALVPQMKEPQRSTAAANIAGVQAQAGDFEAASPATRYAGGVLYSMVKQGLLPAALERIAKMPADARPGAYSSVAEALLQGRKYADAVSVVQLFSRDRRNSIESVRILMRIYEGQWKAGERKDASLTLDEALGVAERDRPIPEDIELTPGSFQIRSLPPVATYSGQPSLFEQIVQRLSVAGNEEVARAIVDRLAKMAALEQNTNIRQGFIGPLADAQADIGDFAAALRTVEPIRAEFFGQNFVARIAVEQARQGDLAGALSIVADMSGGFGDATLYRISRTLSDSGDYAGARKAVDNMKGAGQRAFGLAGLAYEQARKDPAGARLNAALAWTLAQDGRSQMESYEFQNTLEFVAAARASLGDTVGALEIINGSDLRNGGWPLAIVVQHMVEAGNKEQALELSRGQSSLVVRALCLRTIAGAMLDQIQTANQKPR